METPTTTPSVRLAFGRHASLMARVGDAWRPARALAHPYVLTRSESTFARDVLRTRTQMWLFRCDQQGFCGDFIVLDRSSGRGQPVRCWAIELKCVARLRLGRPGIQLANFQPATAVLARALGIALRAPTPVIGSRRDVLRVLSAPTPR